MLRGNCALCIGHIIYHVYFDIKKSHQNESFPGIVLRCKLQGMEIFTEVSSCAFERQDYVIRSVGE